MIHTVTLNPAIDKTVSIANFNIDTVNRVLSLRRDPGGKGINVSKVIKKLGGQSLAWGFVGGQAGRFITDSLAELGISCQFVEIAGETRTNLKVHDPQESTHTDINEAGPAISPADLATLETRLFDTMQAGDLLVLSGSVPTGVDSGLYGRWISRASQKGVRSLLDADGELLRLGIAASPSLVKPNIHELRRLTGKALDNPDAVIKAAQGLVDKGIATVVVSLGTEGSLFVNADDCFQANAIRVEAKSTVGAGDSMLAAIALTLEHSSKLEDLIVPAVSTATAAVITEGSSACDPQTIAQFTPLIRYTSISKRKKPT